MNWRSLDFAPRVPWQGLLLVLAAALVLLPAVPRWLDARDALAQANARVLVRARASAPAPAAPGKRVSRERAVAINAAVTALNLPWPALLGVLEHTRPADVDIVSLEPGEPATRVRLTIESGSLDSNARFVSDLVGRAPIRSAVLLRQERLPAPADGRVRTIVDLEWQ